MKSYLITDPEYYSSFSSFSTYLHTIYKQHQVDYACFRDKQNGNFKELAEIFLKISQTYKIKKTLINGDITLAKELGFFGVHLTSQQFAMIETAKAEGLFVVISTHSKEEVLRAEPLGADAITYSPIFTSPNKGEPKGIPALKEIVSSVALKTFALGGIIGDEQVKVCQDTGAYGFASIRYFVS